MNLNNVNVKKLSNKKKKKSFLKTCVYTFTTIALVVASVVGLTSLKPSKKLNLEVVSGDNHIVSTITLTGDTLTEDMLKDEVEEGKVFSGWYYDDNYTQRAKVGDKITGNTTLYSRQMSLTEGEYWARVDNQLNAGEISKLPSSPFSSEEGTGTEDDPFIISTSEDMGVFSRLMSESEWEDMYLSSYYKLAGDIRLDTYDVTWPSVGTSSRPFSGTFDGDGHMVYYIYGTKGVFNYVENATIKNLTIKGLKINATETVGGLASFVTGSSIIQNCQMFGDIASNTAQVGGLIGNITGTSTVDAQVITCFTNVIITSTTQSANSYVSGVVGLSEYANIIGCVSNGEVEASGSTVGGIVGCATRTSISHSINASNICGLGNVGGIVGALKDSGSVIKNSFNRGILEANGSNVGGIAGLSEGKICNTFNVAKITALNNSTNVAGIVGYTDKNANISYSYSFGNIFTGSSSISYNPIMNGIGSVNDCGYNNAHEVNGILVESSNQITSNYSNLKSLYDGTVETDQQVLVDSFKVVETYTNYSTSGICWSSESLWLTNFIDFGGYNPNILSNADFTQELRQVTYYINGLKKMIRTYTTTETVSAPTYKGQTVSYYTDSLYTNAYTFGAKLSVDTTLYGKCKTVDEGLQYSVSINPEITSVALNSTNYKAINGHDYRAVLNVRNGKKIKSVSVVMENNSSPIYSFDQSTNELTINDIVGDIVIDPVVEDVLYTVSASGLVNMSISNTSNVAYGSTFNATLTANTGYDLPSSIVVTMNGKTLTSGYTYNKSTGQLSIPNVDGNITISGTAIIKSYTIVGQLTNVSFVTAPTSVEYGKSCSITITASSGYKLPSSIEVLIGGTKITSGYTYNSSTGSITITSVTGNVTIIATGEKEVTAIKIFISGGGEDGGYLTIDGKKYSSTTYPNYAMGTTIKVGYDGYYDCELYYSLDGKNWISLPVAGVTTSTLTISNVTTSSGEINSFVITNATQDVYIQICSSCVVEGTYVTLANGKKKKIEDVTYDDELLVWDFDNGCFAKAKPFWIKKPEKADALIRCEFSDGTVLEFVNGHAIFDIQEGKFINTADDNFKVGYSKVYNEKQEEVLLVKKEIVYKPVMYYNVHTMHHMNCFTNGILTSIAENSLYPVKDMKFIKDNREIIPYEEFEKEGVPRRYYDGLRMGEQTRELKDRMIRHYRDMLGPVEVEYKETK